MMVTSRPIAGASNIAISHVGSGTLNGLSERTGNIASVDNPGATELWYHSTVCCCSARKQERKNISQADLGACRQGRQQEIRS